MTRPTYIQFMSSFHPGEPIDNRFFSDLDIGSDESWIEDRTGIRSRHSVLAKEDILRLGKKETSIEQLRAAGSVMSVAEMAQRSIANWPSWPQAAEALDTVICGTSIADFTIPANASSIAAAVSVSAAAYDVNSACSSFVTGLHVARALIGTGSSTSALLVNPERYTLSLDFNDRNSCVLFGDACATTLLSSEQGQRKSLEVIDTFVDSDPRGFEKVQIPLQGHFIQDGKAVQKFAISKTVLSVQTILKRNGLGTTDISYFVGHQANLRMLESARKRLELSPKQHLFNVDRCGNQGAAGAPAVLAANWESFRDGDLIAAAVVGSGLTWGAALLRVICP